ncbi:Nickel/cobalt transporter regulator [Polaromonas sp. OV174]|uniref:RcnB family protein n=1 Tax=Polaromonas sp. OV174 TaxID=1855300 RepID=UPI0008E1B1C7|nr:RcnB family protein [Polaromonas sp. OV174]SFB73441.1 Nickel/cobalt transporter regulator [Polaromonas sp. OV174]
MTTMKSTTIACAIAVAGMGFSSLSFAQHNDWRTPSQARPPVQQYGPQYGPQPSHPSHVRPVESRPANRYDHGDMRRNDRGFYYNARGPEFRRGGYIPRDYRNRQYVVNNYRAYHLSPPPRGQQWVQVGSDYVLIAIATGLIANIVLNH